MNSTIYKFLFLLTVVNTYHLVSTSNLPNTQKIDYISKMPEDMIKEILEKVTDPVECIQTIDSLALVSKNLNTFLGKDSIQKMLKTMRHVIMTKIENIEKKYSKTKELVKEIEEIIALREKDEAFKKTLIRYKPMQYKIAGKFMKAYSYPLHEAAKLGFTEIIDVLIQRYESDVNKAKEFYYNETPLHIAAKKGHAEVVKMLLDHKADVDKADFIFGQTPLAFAAKKGHAEVVKMLLDHKADVDKGDSQWGETPLLCAAWKGHRKIVKMLLDHKADVDKACSKWGETPLHWAAVKGHTEVVELLLKAGANKNIKSKKGKAPLDFAVEKGHTEIVELLKKKLNSGYKRKFLDMN